MANAGVAEPSGGVEVNSAGVREMMAVNVMGVVWAFEAVLPGMLAAKSGHLVAVGSLAGLRGLPGWSGYCASKAAVRAYCESLRAELGPLGVAVTCVQPGFIATPMTAGDTHAMPFLDECRDGGGAHGRGPSRGSRGCTASRSGRGS